LDRAQLHRQLQAKESSAVFRIESTRRIALVIVIAGVIIGMAFAHTHKPLQAQSPAEREVLDYEAK
jgi:hypothetical protein